MTRISGDSEERNEKLAADVKRQFGDGATARFLRALPAYRVARELPEHLKELLERLDSAEDRAARLSRN